LHFKSKLFTSIQKAIKDFVVNTKKIPVIIFDESHLRDRLGRSFLSSFNQRIQLKFHLTPLQKEEVEPYINHHLTIKGCQKSPFTPQAIEAIYKNTAGIPRLIGSLAIKTLMLGYLEKTQILTEEHVFKASCEL